MCEVPVPWLSDHNRVESVTDQSLNNVTPSRDTIFRPADAFIFRGALLLAPGHLITN